MAVEKGIDWSLRATDGFSGTFAKAAQAVTGLEGSIGRVQGLMATITGAGLTTMAASIVRASEEAALAQRRLEAVVRATGNASGYTMQQLGALADALERSSSFDGEGFKEATAVLLRFGNIGGANLEKVLRLSADYAALTGGELTGAAEALGRALNNPAEGLKRLERNFGDLGKETEEAIKLQAQMGNSSRALEIAIEALQKKIGGADQSINTGLTGSMRGLSKALGDVAEALGGLADNSVVTSVLDGLTSRLRGVKELMEGQWTDKLLVVIGALMGRAGVMLSAIGNRAPGVVTPGQGSGPVDLGIVDEGFDARGQANARIILERREAERRAREEWLRERERMRDLDIRGWVAYAEHLAGPGGVFDQENKDIAKLNQERFDAEEELRQMELEGQESLARNVVEVVNREQQEIVALERRANEARLREWQHYGDLIAGGFASAFSDLLDGSIKKWSDFAARLGDIFKSVVVDFVGNAIRGMMNNLMTQLASGSFSLSGLMGGVNPLALAFAGGSIGANLITGALGSGARGQQIGTYAGGAGATLGFALGGPIGAIAGAVIGGLIGHFSDPDGLAQRGATFGPMAGARGPTQYQYTSPFGTFGLSDTSWFSDQDMGEDLRRYFSSMARWEGQIAGFLTPEEIARVTGALGTSGRYGFGEEHGDFSGALGEMTADRANTILGAIDPYLQTLIEGFEGTGEELGQFVITLLSMRKALEEMNITGLDMETLGLMAQAGETLEQTFQRVAGTWAWFTQNFYTEAERLDMATADVNEVFATLGIAVPGSLTEFRKLVEGLDLSTESGRAMWNMLMGVAPAFLLVMNAADGATTSTEGLSRALEEQAELQRRIADDVRESRLRQLDNVINARAGLQRFLGTTALNQQLTVLTPQERLAEAQRQYDEILNLARGGDLNAAGRLGGAAETYLGIARELFGSSSRYVDIFNAVTGDVRGVDDRLAIDQRILEATLGMAATMEQVRDILLDIRDKPPPTVAAGAKHVAR